jgi:hypothetical protein
MSVFPTIDPIPLPAPVWLFKTLHVLVLPLHFVAVQMLLGGLLVALALSGGARAPMGEAATAIARRLPAVMTYVINLGVPPLLFTQVLYGPALYTSSVLIAAYWISVILLLMGSYWLLYRFADRLGAGRRAWPHGLAALVLAACVSRILSTNMALMLRPEVWRGLYLSSGSGLVLPPHDPTLLPRWLFMLAGGGTVAGLWMVWISGRRSVRPALARFLARSGASLAMALALVQAGLLDAILKSQPPRVVDGLWALPLYRWSAVGWGAAACMVLAWGAWVHLRRSGGGLAGYAAAAIAVLLAATWTIVRDGIRDLTLSGKGFDVWRQPVEINGPVLALFFLIFALGLAALVWLVWVLRQAQAVPEGSQ